ncbi:hypothetical protein I3843_01G077300 [Carya illinoinensis]|uniref:Uncharacterized protein n=1 Tax=Carya illinoinensis TaxID=32201 RepID=A0A922FXR3_CARIL|nr:hypothetical protein I3842_01G079000 [Carya illinoinensis]KAG7994813.1 hypothetical protein I3843_01G077300 [Carya illinoinensis]
MKLDARDMQKRNSQKDKCNEIENSEKRFGFAMQRRRKCKKGKRKKGKYKIRAEGVCYVEKRVFSSEEAYRSKHHRLKSVLGAESRGSGAATAVAARFRSL